MTKYDDQGFKGTILYGIREVVDNGDINISKMIRYPVATFTSEKAANEYVIAARLVSPQGGGATARVSFKKTSLLAGCFSATVGPKPNVANLPVDPTPIGREVKQRQETQKQDKPKRKRRTKAEMAAIRAAEAAQETVAPKRRGRPPKKKAIQR